MKLQEYREAYYEFSERASDVARAAALGGLAIIWIFKTQIGEHPALPRALLWPTMLILAALGCDLLQYVAGALIWGIVFRHRESHQDDRDFNQDADHSAWLPVPIQVLFFMKFGLMVLSYVLLARFAVRQLFQ